MLCFDKASTLRQRRPGAPLPEDELRQVFFRELDQAGVLRPSAGYAQLRDDLRLHGAGRPRTEGLTGSLGGGGGGLSAGARGRCRGSVML